MRKRFNELFDDCRYNLLRSKQSLRNLAQASKEQFPEAKGDTSGAEALLDELLGELEEERIAVMEALDSPLCPKEEPSHRQLGDIIYRRTSAEDGKLVCITIREIQNHGNKTEYVGDESLMIITEKNAITFEEAQRIAYQTLCNKLSFIAAAKEGDETRW